MTTDQRLEAKEQRRKADQQFREKLVDEIATNYGFSEEIAKACVDKGWEDGHSAGYGEVRAQTEITADFVEKILTIIKNENKWNWQSKGE